MAAVWGAQVRVVFDSESPSVRALGRLRQSRPTLARQAAAQLVDGALADSDSGGEDVEGEDEHMGRMEDLLSALLDGAL